MCFMRCRHALRTPLAFGSTITASFGASAGLRRPRTAFAYSRGPDVADKLDLDHVEYIMAETSYYEMGDDPPRPIEPFGEAIREAFAPGGAFEEVHFLETRGLVDDLEHSGQFVIGRTAADQWYVVGVDLGEVV